ncbi:zinc-binding alcohol dehydrogenase family protein [Niabella terrae]
MKTLICTLPGSFEYAEIRKPVRKKGHAIIRVRRIGICGTDLHAFQGTQPFFSYPRILGHELSGEIADIDPVPGFKTGDKVTLLPYFSCGKCVACKRGKSNCCAKIDVFGVHIDGGMKEFISVPVGSLVKGRGLSFEELALTEPLAIGAHGVRRAGVQPGDYVLVIGAGPIGLGTMEFARIAGARVIAMDVNAQRLDFCRRHLSVFATVNAMDHDLPQQLMQLTGGDMPTAVIDATGNLRAINQGIDYLAHGGNYVLIGLQKEAFSFSHPEFHKRETTLMSSRNATREDFDHVIRCMKKGWINPATYITHTVSFDQVKAEFESWLMPETGVIKAMVQLD